MFWNFEFCIRSTWVSSSWREKVFRPAVLLVQRFFEKVSSGNTSSARMCFTLKFWILYLENMRFEEVARLNSRCSCTPDISNFRKIFKLQYLENRDVFLDEIWDLYEENMRTEEVACQKPSVQNVCNSVHYLYNLMQMAMENAKNCCTCSKSTDQTFFPNSGIILSVWSQLKVCCLFYAFY